MYIKRVEEGAAVQAVFDPSSTTHPTEYNEPIIQQNQLTPLHAKQKMESVQKMGGCILRVL